MKRLELILFRFTCLAAVGGFLFCIAAFFANSAHEQKLLAILFGCVGPIGVMATFYAIRWALTGRIKPWVPN